MKKRMYKPILSVSCDIEEKFFNAPFTVMIKLTNNCNANCSFCSQGKKKNIELSEENLLKILSLLEKRGIKNIIYSGGEPVLYKRINKLLRASYEKGFNYSLVTNGLLLDKIKYENLYCIDSIGISMHAIKKKYDKIMGMQGAFRILCNNIEMLEKRNLTNKIIINYTVSDMNNVEDLKEVINFCRDKRITLNIARLNYIGNAATENICRTYNNFLECLSVISKNVDMKITVSNVVPACILPNSLKGYAHGCSAGVGSIAINADGSMTDCGSNVMSSGDFFEDGFEKKWVNRVNELLDISKKPYQCENCKYYMLCKGGCRAEILRKGDYGSSDSLFEYYQNLKFMKIGNKPLHNRIKNIKKIDNHYMILDPPIRVINQETLNFLSCIENKSMLDLVTMSQTAEKLEVRDLLLTLINDGHCSV